MKNLILNFYTLAFFISFISCSKEERNEDLGIPTELKGHVSDNVRGINISGYKIVFVKIWSDCSNWACGLRVQDVATAYTDNNGEYTIKFNYKLNPGETYGISEQYYGTPYYPEYLPSSSSGGIKAGQTNTININAWKPITLKLNLIITNNSNSPLNVRNEINNNNQPFLNTESIYEQNINKTIYLNSKPDNDIKIIFWYYSYTNNISTLHQKTILYHTTVNNTDVLNYNIDCSTF